MSKILLPNIGDFKGVEVIEIHIKDGDSIKKEQIVITLETDKATMDIPAESEGVISKVLTKVGDKISEGTPIYELKPQENQETTQENQEAKEVPADDTKKASDAIKQEAEIPASEPEEKPTKPATKSDITTVHTSPLVRRLAFELDIDLTTITGTAAKGRISKQDILNHLSKGAHSSMPTAPTDDFSKYGTVEEATLTKIQQLSGKFLQRNWQLAPHITLYEDADVTDLEAFRLQLNNQKNAKIKLTPIAFIVKAVAHALMDMPKVNRSFSGPDGEIVVKKYAHIGVAVDTPQGLMVPVIKNADQKGVNAIAEEIIERAKEARDGTLKIQNMQGGCFTISSLGHIGLRAFAPIVNLPEPGILGVARATMQPVYNQTSASFDARLMMPLSASFDHQIVDGVAGARFLVRVSQLLSNIQQLVL